MGAYINIKFFDYTTPSIRKVDDREENGGERKNRGREEKVEKIIMEIVASYAIASQSPERK